MTLTRRFDKEQSLLCNVFTLVNMICSSNKQAFFEQLATESEPKLETNSLVDEYRGAIEGAKAYSEQQGAVFYHFMQPMLWSRSLSTYEQAVNNNPNLVSPFMDAVYQVAWQDMHLSYTIDFTHILDDLRQQGVEVFLDPDHITHPGTKVVAEALYASLLPNAVH